MVVKVRFRFNKRTGEIEEFLIDQESGLPVGQHNRVHTQRAAEIARVVESMPRIEELAAGTTAAEGAAEEQDEEVRQNEQRHVRED